MKHLIFKCWLIVCCFICANCDDGVGDNKPPETEIPNNDFATEIFKDRSFESGFGLKPLNPADMNRLGFLDTLYFKAKTDAPLWHLAQWNSKHNLAEAVRQTDPDGSLFFANAGKRVALYPDNSLLLELNASEEYNHPRLSGESWPHLLIEQNFTFSPSVSTAKKILFSMEIMLVKCENKMVSGTYDPSKHTAQSPLYLVIRDSKTNSYIWFGIPSFDFRYMVLKDQSSTSWDEGTQTYISSAAPRTIWGNVNLHDKQWHKADIDIRPFILAAFESVKREGKFQTTKLEDLKITGMNFGWEVPGTFDAAIRVKNISLKIMK